MLLPKNIHYVLVSTLCLASLVQVFASRAFAEEPKKATHVVLLLNYTPSGQHAAFAYGIEKGYFSDEGIDLKVIPGKGSPVTVKQVAHDDARFGFGDSIAVAIADSNADADVRMIGTYFGYTQFGLSFIPGGPIRKPTDLKGKRIGMVEGDAPRQLLPIYLKVIGLKSSDVSEVITDAKEKPKLLINGKADAIGDGESSNVLSEGELGRPLGFLKFSQYIHVPGDGLMVNAKYLTGAQDKELNCRMLRATSRAFVEAKKHPDDAGEAVARVFKDLVSTRDPVIHTKGWKRVMALVGSRGLLKNSVSYTYDDGWNEALQMLKERDVIKQVKPLDRYFTNEYASCSSDEGRDH
jgi:NitT/TauT family transport system substrate-binding protein